MKDGRVIDQDHISKVHQSSRELIMKLRKENDGEPKPEESEGQQDGKLVMDEEIAIGRVGLSSRKYLLLSFIPWLTRLAHSEIVRIWAQRGAHRAILFTLFHWSGSCNIDYNIPNMVSWTLGCAI